MTWSVADFDLVVKIFGKYEIRVNKKIIKNNFSFLLISCFQDLIAPHTVLSE